MTRIAPGVGKLIISVRVTRLARRCRVGARERKPRRGVVERCRSPRGRRVTRLARGRESPGRVIR